MFLATGIILHRVASFGRPAAWRTRFGYALTTFLATVSIFHCYLDERYVFQATFVIMVITAGLRVVKLIHQRVSDLAVRKHMQRLARSGTGRLGKGRLT